MPELPPGDTHVASIEIAAPLEKVWAEITKTGRVQRPLYNTVLETDLRPGSPVKYYSPDGKRIFVIGRVVEVEPPRRFSHTYMFTTKDEPSTLVTWELEESPGGCRVTVTHSGWTDAHRTADKSAAGWREILGLLKSELETGRIPFKTRLMYGVMDRMMFLMPKSTLAVNAVRRIES